MQTRIYIFIIVMAGIAVSDCLAQTSLEVTIRKIKESKGTIRVGLFASEKDFLNKAVVGKVVKANEGEVKVTFEDLPSGEYAISIIHDENENGELDSNMVGLPKEGFAFGNNAMGMFGPPSFEKAKIVIDKNKKESQSIDMKYL